MLEARTDIAAKIELVSAYLRGELSLTTQPVTELEDLCAQPIKLKDQSAQPITNLEDHADHPGNHRT